MWVCTICLLASKKKKLLRKQNFELGIVLVELCIVSVLNCNVWIALKKGVGVGGRLELELKVILFLSLNQPAFFAATKLDLFFQPVEKWRFRACSRLLFYCNLSSCLLHPMLALDAMKEEFQAILQWAKQMKACQMSAPRIHGECFPPSLPGTCLSIRVWFWTTAHKIPQAVLGGPVAKYKIIY